MKILFLAAEASPLSKAGGLADVAGALPRALAALGHDVRVAIPFRGLIDRQRHQPRLVTRFDVPHVAGAQVARVSEVRLGGVTFYLLAGPPIPRARRIYGRDISEDGPKFIFFSLAALGLCKALDWAPDVLHANDSHTGPAVYWLATDGARDEFFRATASVFTIHNLAYMNTGAARHLLHYGLAPSDAPLLPDWARDSLMGLGLAHADALNAVSPRYAREILTPEFGYGLETVLQARADRLTGILNGLDLDEWDPQRDPHLALRYDAETIRRRAVNKRAVQTAFDLPTRPGLPLLAMVSRLDTQKGFDLLLPALRRLMAASTRFQFVLLGAGLPALEVELRALARDFPANVGVRLSFDAPLARLIYAGADLLLLPSRYEPCGLAQMIGLRYGAVPVVRQVGGLADTVIDYAETRRGTGFVFTDYNPEALLQAIERALAVLQRPERWRALQRRGMRQALQFSWANSAPAYLALYQLALTKRKEAVDHIGSLTAAELN